MKIYIDDLDLEDLLVMIFVHIKGIDLNGRPTLLDSTKVQLWEYLYLL